MQEKDYKAQLLSYSRFDSYKLNGEDSQLHWEAMTHRSHRHVKMLEATSWALVLIIGFRRRSLSKFHHGRCHCLLIQPLGFRAQGHGSLIQPPGAQGLGPGSLYAHR